MEGELHTLVGVDGFRLCVCFRGGNAGAHSAETKGDGANDLRQALIAIEVMTFGVLRRSFLGPACVQVFPGVRNACSGLCTASRAPVIACIRTRSAQRISPGIDPSAS